MANRARRAPGRSTAPAPAPTPPRPGRSTVAGVLIGVGLMAGVDEIVFHQVLAWHHFYDGGTTHQGLVTDGLLHAAELVLLVIGFLLFASLRRAGALAGTRTRAAVFLGLGGFQLFDGVVVHKVLRLHQIRYGVEPLPYDIAWNAAGAVLLAVGAALWWRARTASR